ncbi:MAG TPA: T9SS type A sorting domain-containing protein [Elusimicrobiota bacterium]|nr:T9SS type A sorting domain-containing protein [Elusimicrobiota bacterium]
MLWASCAQAAAAAWTATTPLPDAFDGHTLVYSSGRLYQMGGISTGGGILDGVKVFSASASDAGAVGAWTSQPNLPEAVYYHTSAAVNGFVYVLGGFHYTDAAGIALSNVVYRAKVNSDGSLGAWQADTPLPQPVFFPSAASWNGRIYLTGGWNGSVLLNSVYSSQVNADGSLGPWLAQKPLPQGVYTHAAVSNGTLYVLGGTVNGGNDIANTVYYAQINADGTLSDWATTSPLPTPVSNHTAAVANGHVFVLGGWDGNEPISAVDSALVGPDGSLSVWNAETPLPRPLYLHATAESPSYLFVSGGIDGTGIRAETYSMPLPPPPLPSDVLPPRTSFVASGTVVGGLTFLSSSSPAGLSSVDDRSVVGDGDGVGVASTQLSVDGAPFAPYAAPIVVHTDGGHLFQFMSADKMGHTESIKSASAAVDGTPPVSTLSVGAPRATLATGETVVGPATPLAVSAVDPVVNGAASGVAAALAGVDGAALAPSSASFVLPAGDGAHVVITQAVDAVGNAEAPHGTTVYLDSTSPQTTLALSSPAFAAADGGAPILGAGALVTFTAADPASGGGVAAGVARTEYAVDGGTVSAYTGPFGLTEGAHALTYRSLDNVGNAEAWRSAAYRSDLTPPISSLTWTEAPNSATTRSSFSISAQDPSSNGVASGVSRVVYSVDGGADAAYAAPFSLALGTHTVSYAAADNAGNVEARNVATVSVGPADSLPPRTTLAFGAPSFGPVPFLSPATPATLTAVDDALSVGDAAGVGVASTQWALDGGSFTAYAAPIRIATDGVHWIRYMSVDNAGHAEAVRASSAAVDGTAPVSSLSVGDPQTALASGEIVVGPATQLTVSAADPLVNGVASGVAWTRAGIDGAAPAAVTAPFTLPATDGAHAIALQSADNVGNTEAVHSATVYRDATPPVTTASFSAAPYAAASGPIYGAAAVLTFAASDPAASGAAAGVNRTEYSLDGGSWTVYGGAFAPSEGAHSLSYRSVDNVGNVETARTLSFAVDATAPQTTLSVDGGTTLFGADVLTTAASLTLAATDPAFDGTASGVARVVYSVDGGADAVYSGPFHLAAGAHTVSYGAVDNAGNAETRRTASLTVGTFLADALAGLDSVTLSGGAGVTGTVRTNGAFAASGKSTVTGDVFAKTDSLDGQSAVSGSVTLGQATLSEAYDLAAAAARASANNNDAAVPALSGGALTLSGGTVALPAGDYYLTGLSLSGKASLTVSGRVNIFLHGPLSVTGQAQLNSTGDANDLWIVSDSGDVSLSGQGRAALNLYAPASAASISGGGEFAGHVLAQSVSLSGNSAQPSAAALPPAAHGSGGAEHIAQPAAQSGNGTAGQGRANGRDSAVASFRLDSAGPSGSVAHGSSAASAGAPSGPAPVVASATPGAPHDVKHLPPAAAPSSGSGTAGPGRSGGHDVAVVAGVLGWQDAARSLGGPTVPGLPAGAAAPSVAGPAGRTAHSRMPAFPLAPHAAFSAVTADGTAVRAGDRTAVVIPAGATSGLGVTVAPSKPNALDAKRQSDDGAAHGLIAASAGVQYGPEGTRFAVPVTLELPYNRATLPAGVTENDLAIHYWNPATGAWEKLASSVDTQNQIVRAQTSHFSLYQLFGGGITVLANGDPTFTFHDAYVYPNPARGAGTAIFVIQVGQADSVEVHVYDVTGRRVHASANFTVNPSFDDGNGKGVQVTYQHAWDLSGVASGVYTYVITAKKAGSADIHKTGKIGVIK